MGDLKRSASTPSRARSKPRQSLASRIAVLREAREGATIIEYTLMAALFGIAVLVGSTAVRDGLVGTWEENLLPQLLTAFGAGGEEGE